MQHSPPGPLTPPPQAWFAPRPQPSPSVTGRLARRKSARSWWRRPPRSVRARETVSWPPRAGTGAGTSAGARRLLRAASAPPHTPLPAVPLPAGFFYIAGVSRVIRGRDWVAKGGRRWGQPACICEHAATAPQTASWQYRTGPWAEASSACPFRSVSRAKRNITLLLCCGLLWAGPQPAPRADRLARRCRARTPPHCNCRPISCRSRESAVVSPS